MAKTKGADIVALRAVFKAKEASLEEAFLAKLSPGLLALYRTALSITWSPIEVQTELYSAAAETLFPGQSDAMVQLGKALAQKQYSGLYRLFLRFPTPEYLVSEVAVVWNSYHDKGIAEIKNYTGRSGTLVVRNYPELPRKMRELISGHLIVLLELTGQTEVQVIHDDHEPNAWQWHISYPEKKSSQ